MSIKTGGFNDHVRLYMLFVIVAIAVPINGLETRKLDESTVPGTTGEKCSPCTQSPPPPPPPELPPPPPPELPPPVLPPPAFPPPSPYCPPPPSPKKPPSPNNPQQPPPPSFIYITGPPGNLYPVDQNFGGAARDFVVGLPVLVSCGFLSLVLVFW